MYELEAYKELKKRYKEVNIHFLEGTRRRLQDIVVRMNFLRDWTDDDEAQELVVLANILLEKYEEYLSKIADYD